MAFARSMRLAAGASLLVGCSAKIAAPVPDEPGPLNTVQLVVNEPDADPGDAAALCPSAFTACGGDPTGTWQVVASCSTPAPPPMDPGPCAGISSFAPDANEWTGGYLPRPSQPSSASLPGSVAFNADHSYQSVIRSSTEGTYHFDPSCLEVLQAQDCDALTATLVTVSSPNYQDLSCTPAGQGCDCSYRYLYDWADQGTWDVQNGKLTLVSSLATTTSPTPTTTADLCVAGDSLQIGAPYSGGEAGQGTRLLGGGFQTLRLTRQPDASM